MVCYVDYSTIRTTLAPRQFNDDFYGRQRKDVEPPTPARHSVDIKANSPREWTEIEANVLH